MRTPSKAQREPGRRSTSPRLATRHDADDHGRRGRAFAKRRRKRARNLNLKVRELERLKEEQRLEEWRARDRARWNQIQRQAQERQAQLGGAR